MAGDGPGGGCGLHHVFEAWAEREPERRALSHQDCRLTYRELNQRSNQLARHLLGLGVGPERIVGLHLDRSIETLVGMLGILKSGAAYLPLDPGYPIERLRYMLDDSGADLMVTRSDLDTDLATATEQGRVCLDRDAEAIFRHEPGDVDLDVPSRNLMYVIYTSGSTGRPKGVMVEHGTVARLFESSRAFFDFRPDDTWTLFHSCSFGFSVWEIWGALLHGAGLVVVPDSVVVSPTAFYDLVCDEQVTVLSQTPSAFKLFVEADATIGRPDDLDLRAVVFSGEAVEPGALRSWISRHGDERPSLSNTYALTETGGAVAHHRLTADDFERPAPSRIGLPLPHARIHLLDDRLQPVGEETPAEMYIGGEAVARGYWNRPELTAERFVEISLPGAGPERCYRTGDLACRLPDGRLEFRGRSDQQIKIRGFRVEPAEIEAALLEVGSVAEAVVVARPGGAGGSGLVAYLVTQGRNDRGGSESAQPTDTAYPSDSLSPESLRATLEKRLPDYMVPETFVVVDALPLTPSGKLDRNALPDPAPHRPETARALPRTEGEKVIFEVWEEVLETDQFGVNDDFLAVGGNSLAAMQVILRVFHRLRVDLSLRSIMETRTIAELAELIETIEWFRRRSTGATAPAAVAEEGRL